MLCALFLVAEAAFAASQRVAAGTSHTLVITPYGTVIASGSNSYGQLGNAHPVGTGNPPVPASITNTEESPVNVANLTNIVAVGANVDSSIALDSQGRVWVWGRNDYGQLAKPISGANRVVFSAVPIQVTNLPLPQNARIVEISAGDRHDLARDSFGNVYGWGANDRGQLAAPSVSAYSTPFRIPLISGGQEAPASAVSAGRTHSLALTQSGVWSWGANTQGQLGDGSAVPPSTSLEARDRRQPYLIPSTQPGMSDGSVFAIAAGGNHSLALFDDGRLLAWGSNTYRQLGNNQTVDLRIPSAPALPVALQYVRFTSISGGLRHSAAYGATGAYTWGNNAVGQLGVGDLVDRGVPTAAGIYFQLGVAYPLDIVAGGYRTVFLYAGNDPGTLRIFSSGDNNKGQIGDGTITDRSSSSPGASPTFAAVAAGRQHSLAVTSGGNVLAWGDDTYEQLGDGENAAPPPTTPPTPTPIGGIYNASAGAVRQPVPRKVQIAPDSAGAIRYLTGISQVAAGAAHSLALKQNGRVLAWGRNSQGQVGNGTTTSVPYAVTVPGIAEIRSIAASNGTSAAVDQSGRIWVWGSSPFGGGNYTQPTVVYNDLTKPAPVAIVGVDHEWAAAFIVLRADGKLVFFGNNNSILPGSINQTIIFSEIAGFTDIKSVSAGRYHILATDSMGRVWIMGSTTWWAGPDTSPQAPVGPNGHAAYLLPEAGQGVSIFAAGTAHSLIVKQDGSLFSFGRNRERQLGDASGLPENNSLVRPQQVQPVRIPSARNPLSPALAVSTPPRFAMVAAGYAHSIAVDHAGQIWAWGDNSRGQAGAPDNVIGTTSSPVLNQATPRRL